MDRQRFYRAFGCFLQLGLGATLSAQAPAITPINEGGVFTYSTEGIINLNFTNVVAAQVVTTQAIAAINASLAAPFYTGLVATHGDVSNNSNSGVTWIMDRSYHIARQTIPANSVRVVWGNWWVNGSNVEAGTGSATFKASIEYPAGTIAGTCTFQGVTQPTIASAANAIADSCPHATIPNGAAFWVRALYVNTSGGIIFATGNFSTTLEGAVYGSGTPTDLTGGGSVSSGAGVGFHPLAIIGTTQYPSVCMVGDSRVAGQGDNPNDATLDIGEFARSIGPVFAYTKLAVAGTSLNTAVTNFTHRLTIAAYCSHFIDEYGINDIGGGQTAAQVATNRTTMAGLLPGPVFGATLPTETTSTDSWATTTNQTSSGNPSVVTTFNGLVRAGIAGEMNFFDIANAVDPLALGKWPVSKITGATSGSANFATADGIHETTAMAVIIAQLGTVNTQAITRR